MTLSHAITKKILYAARLFLSVPFCHYLTFAFITYRISKIYKDAVILILAVTYSPLLKERGWG